MRILIAGEEVCGIIGTYQEELRKMGHEVFSVIHDTDRYFSETKYDFFLGSLRPNIPYKFFGKEVLFLEKIIVKIQAIRSRNFIRKRAMNFDLVIYLWRTILVNCADVSILKKNGTKVVFLFVGSEVRYFDVFQKKYNVFNWNPEISRIARKKWRVPVGRLLRYIRIAEKYGDAIYSIPDQAGLQVRPYYHLRIPIDTKKFEFQNNLRKIPKVIHAPSHPWHKGSDLIEAVLEKLKNEGIEFEYVRLKGIPHQEVIDYLKDGDILVDGINGHGPGVLAFEAMSCGCAVVVRHLAEYADVFEPPLVHFDVDNIYEPIKKVILDYEFRQELIINGRAYVEKENDVTNVTRNLLENVNNPRKEDYFPVMEMDLIEDADRKIVEEWSNTALY
ncbi:MAG: hypothetical protein COB88_10695 [Flavobacteriales bacterium]|nr:MAG: hypothetical protein COB88_10695 [Flavobacteriales bacterium]